MNSSGLSRRWRADNGGVISGWIIQIVLFVAVLGFVGYELISVVVTTVNLDATAKDVARAAARTYDGRSSETLASEKAAAAAAEDGADIVSIVFDTSTGFVIVEVTKEAPTIIIHKIGFLEGLTSPVAEGRTALP